MSARKALVSAALVGAAMFGLVAPADAGDGPSERYCRDEATINGQTGREVRIAPSAITLDVEVAAPNPTYVQVCYSTSAPGSTAPTLTGGVIRVGTFGVECFPDSNIVLAVSCSQGQDGNAQTRTVTLTFQGTPVTVGPLGAGSDGFGGVGGASCLRQVQVIIGSNRIGPHDIGVC